MSAADSTIQRRLLSILYSVVAIVIGLGISFAAIGLTGTPIDESITVLLEGAFGSSAQVSATIARMVPLIIVGLGWIVAARCNIFNIGLDGQIILGGILATVVALFVPAPSYVLLPLAIVCGIAGGAIWAGIAAVLLATRHVNEIISTLMLNFIAIALLDWLLLDPLKDMSQTRSQTEELPSATFLPSLGQSKDLKWDLVIAVMAVIGTSVLLRRTTFGFRMRLVSANENAAHRVGVRGIHVRVYAFLLSGAAAGIVGSFLVLGSTTHVTAPGFNAGYGFDGIVVGLLARGSPWGTIPAALLISSLHQGGGLMQAELGVPSELLVFTQGLVIVLVAVTEPLLNRLRSRRADTGELDDAPLEVGPGVAVGG